ncbi:four helix bundle protein [Bacillus sp. REN16]|uniref:four helix bundle protein n=1 Tax=Bacillus sp. REN16 TaxID=2887296 RepID=UPI001E5525F8|nr:four helix bundle protein [Bacillus sp. REN16]MCC3359415.1 four helix bundle protein [Bacillus sp. REN16]
MKDISELEKVGIEYYLSQHRANQIYDNLEEFLNIQSPKELSTATSCNPKKSTTPSKEKQIKKQHRLEVRDVKQLFGYKKAKELEEKIIELSKSFPSYEKKHVVDQIQRSAKSIKERIAMGEQVYIGEKFNQYSISIGSAKETSAWLQISLGQKYIEKEQYDNLDNLVNEVVSILTKILCHLRDNEGKGMDLPNPYTPNVKNFGAYEDALLLVERIYEITRQQKFWQEKDLLYGLRQCATSNVANLAEGHQLFPLKKFKFFNNALEALSGLESRLQTSLSKQIITEETFSEMEELAVSVKRRIKRILKNLSDQKLD